MIFMKQDKLLNYNSKCLVKLHFFGQQNDLLLFQYISYRNNNEDQLLKYSIFNHWYRNQQKTEPNMEELEEPTFIPIKVINEQTVNVNLPCGLSVTCELTQLPMSSPCSNHAAPLTSLASPKTYRYALKNRQTHTINYQTPGLHLAAKPHPSAPPYCILIVPLIAFKHIIATTTIPTASEFTSIANPKS